MSRPRYPSDAKPRKRPGLAPVYVALQPEEKAAVQAVADRAGVSLSAWCALAIVAALGRDGQATNGSCTPNIVRL